MNFILRKRKRRAPPIEAPRGPPEGKGGFKGPPPKNKKELVNLRVDSGVYLGVILGEEGFLRGSFPKNKKELVYLAVDLGVYLGVDFGERRFLGVPSPENKKE